MTQPVSRSISQPSRWVAYPLVESGRLSGPGLYAGGHIKLLHLQGKVRDLLQIVKFYAVFPVFEDEATAVRSFSSSAAAGKLFL